MIGRHDIEGSKCYVATHTWSPRVHFPHNDISMTSNLLTFLRIRNLTFSQETGMYSPFSLAYRYEDIRRDMGDTVAK